MKILALVRLTYEPKEVSELNLDSGKIHAGRVSLTLNEGDVKGIQLINSMKAPFDAISIGVLDNISRVHTFVRGAGNIFELGEQLAHSYNESALASLVVSQVKSIGGVQLVVCSPIEQDSGRGLLPGVLAAKLGWELFINVTKIIEKEGAFLIEQQLESGRQSYLVKGPIVICPDETCVAGDDPSDAFELIEKLDKKETQKISSEKLLSAEKPAIEISLELPPTQAAQPVVSFSDEVVKKVLALIKPFSN